MKNKYLYITFIALFLCVSLLLSGGILVFGESKAGANENLSEKPVISGENGFNDMYLGNLADYVNDRFCLRQELISLNNLISAKIFGTSGSDSVILGVDGWLFYDLTLNDYTGLNAMTERETFMAANNVKLMQQYCQSKGTEFQFMVAPNKNSLYPLNMPDLGKADSSLNAKRLHAEFNRMGVKYIDIFEAFKNEPVLYYKTDSHWNIKGAALAADKVNNAFGIDGNYYNGSFSVLKNGYTGDLYKMLYPSLKGGEDEIVYNGTLNYSTKTPNVKYDSFNIKTESSNEGNILVYRDSFGNILYPFIADSYGSAEFSRDVVYDLTKDADFVLIELVERNIPWLIENLAVIESQPVAVTLPGTLGFGTVTVTQSKGSAAPKGRDLWRGVLNVALDSDSSVYVDSGNAVYEALLTADNGFAVYLPEGAEPLSIGFKVDGKLQSVSVVCVDDGTAEPTDPNIGADEVDHEAYNKASTLIDQSVQELYELIGMPAKSAYLPSCIGDGEDGTLFYNGFAVSTYKDDKGEIVKNVYLN